MVLEKIEQSPYSSISRARVATPGEKVLSYNNTERS